METKETAKGLQKGFKETIKGLWKENPIFRLVIGMCPTLAVTTTAINGFTMGIATLFVLVSSAVLVSLIRKLIPEKVRIPSFIVIVATFVTIADMYLSAYFSEIHAVLGLYVPLIVVNCIILGRMESYASKNNMWYSFLDSFGMGLGFTWGLIIIGVVREFIGMGSIFGFQILGSSYPGMMLMSLPPGAFIVLAILIAIFRKISKKRVVVCG